MYPERTDLSPVSFPAHGAAVPLWQNQQIPFNGAVVTPDCLLRSSASFTPDDESNLLAWASRSSLN